MVINTTVEQQLQIIFKAMNKNNQKVINAIGLAMNKVLKDMEAHAKANHGAGSHTIGRYINRTHNLTQSILATDVEYTQKSIVGFFTSLLEYGKYVELGTVKSEAYPFLSAAIVAKRDNLLVTMLRLGRTALK